MRSMLFLVLAFTAAQAYGFDQQIKCTWTTHRNGLGAKKIIYQSQAELRLSPMAAQIARAQRRPIVGQLTYAVASSEDTQPKTAFKGFAIPAGDEGVDVNHRRITFAVYEADDGKGSNAAIGIPVAVVGRPQQKEFPGEWNLRVANRPSISQQIENVTCTSVLMPTGYQPFVNLPSRSL